MMRPVPTASSEERSAPERRVPARALQRTWAWWATPLTSSQKATKPCVPRVTERSRGFEKVALTGFILPSGAWASGGSGTAPADWHDSNRFVDRAALFLKAAAQRARAPRRARCGGHPLARREPQLRRRHAAARREGAR